MRLDRMLGMEGENGNGEETDFQIGGKGNSDHQQNSLDASSTVDSIESGSLTSPGSGVSLTSPAPLHIPGSCRSLTSPGFVCRERKAISNAV